MRVSIRTLAWLLLTACACAAAQERLPPAVQAALAQAGVPPEALAAVALPLGHRGRPWRHRAEVPMQPGSTMKVLTSIVALDQLGPNHRGFTALLSAAPQQGAVLQGDLVLQGGADPDLGVPQFWQLLLDLRQQGISEIAGDLVVDRSLFRPARPELGVPPFDEAPEFAYNVIPDALQLAGNLMTVELQSGADGVSARSVPPLEGISLRSGMALTDTPCNAWDADWKPARVSEAQGHTLIELDGGFPRHCTQRAELQLIDRQRFTESLFRTLWHGLGGQWQGRAREGLAPAGARLLARRESRAWGELLRAMNKSSDNARSRLLFLSLGLPAMAANPQASTAELAARAVRQWLAERGIADAGLVLDNGSGLSRSERISPWQLASMLKVAHAGRHAPELLMSLPVAGVDGTLRKRLRASPAAGWARLKTGTLSNVAALAGYVNDARGRPWAVAMFINHPNASQAQPALDALVDGIARSGPHGLPAALRPGLGPQGDGP